MTAPDEVLIYGPPGGTFIPSAYPDLVGVVITAGGGGSSDGTPGTAMSRAFVASSLPPLLTIVCGEGGRDAEGRQGDAGYAIIELYLLHTGETPWTP